MSAPRRAALLALLCAGCDPGRFVPLKRHAPVVVFDPPAGVAVRAWGTQLTVTRDPRSSQLWLLAAGDGVDTHAPVTSVALTVDDDDNYVYSFTDVHQLCSGDDACGANGGGGGLSLAAMESWSATQGPDAGAGDGGCAMAAPIACGLTGSLGRSPMVVARCFSRSGCDTTFRITPAATATAQGFGTVVATLPIDWRTAGSRASADLAYMSATDGAGRVFASLPGQLNELTPPSLPSNARFGAALAAGRERDGTILLAVGAPGLREVLLFRGAGAGLTLASCALRGEVAGFGSRVAVGDVDGDGRLDVVAAGDATQGSAPVFLLPATGAPAGAACADGAWTGALRAECSDQPDARVQCGANSRFGASLLAADMDGDGLAEVAVGAPGATVDGAEQAGAVWMLRAGRGDAGAASLLTAGIVRRGEVQRAEALGSALSTWGSTAGRTELAAGAPGGGQSGRVYFFYCSGVSGDRPNEGGLDERCLPTAARDR